MTQTLNLALAALIATAGAAAAGGDMITHEIFGCDTKENLHVVIVQTAGGNGYAVINQMDELIPMEQMRSGSGMQFKAIDKNYTYELAVKGEEATLFAGDKTVATCKK